MGRHHRSLATVFAVATLALLAACGSTDTISGNTSPTTVPETSASPATASSTTAPDGSPTTTSTSTTTTPPTTSTVAPAPTTTTTTTTPGRPPGTPAPATAVALADSALVEIDVASGAIVRTIDDFFEGDGVFRYGLQRDPAGGTAWFGEAYEDSWYACESSYGSVGTVDLASGAIAIVGVGSSPALSPDGTRVAYVASEVCVPDPENSANWVLTPADRVVVRDIASGAERVIVSSPSPAAYDAPTAVTWVGFAPNGDLFAMTYDQTMRRIEDNPSFTLQEHPVVSEALLGFPVAATSNRFVTLELGDEGSSDLFAIDTSGTATLLASSETFMAVSVSGGGHILVASSSPITVQPGAAVTVLEVAGDPFVSAIAW